MRRLAHFAAQAVALVIIWAAIFEIGLRLQQYFGPLYDLEMASINLNWESDVLGTISRRRKTSTFAFTAT